MEHHDLSGTPPVRVYLRRSGRAKRMSLRISRLDGKVTLTLPPRASMRGALAFAEERAGWIRAHLSDIVAPEPVVLGSVVPVEDKPLRIVAGARTALRAEAGEIAVAHRSASVPGAVAGLLKTLARARLGEATDRYAAALGRPYRSLTLRDTRSRWGSCTSRGGLNYSWRLIMAPPEVLDYVAAHEVAHLAEMNHSARFWAAVAQLCPGYAAPRLWLRRNGESLHRYSFVRGPDTDGDTTGD